MHEVVKPVIIPKAMECVSRPSHFNLFFIQLGIIATWNKLTQIIHINRSKDCSVAWVSLIKRIVEKYMNDEEKRLRKHHSLSC